MKPFRSASLAAVSALLWITVAAAARPRYGGMLRVETAAAVRTLNPAAPPVDAADAAARRVLFPLIFETLVTIDADGGIRGVLALNWESDSAGLQWRFGLRPAVRLHDGTPLDSGRIAAALRAREPDWSITTNVSSIIIEPKRPIADLLWQLADQRNAIAFGRPGGGEPIGSGPFAIERWEPKRLRLRAHEEHWNGRPFVDVVHVEMGRPFADVTDLESGRVDFAALRVQDVRRAMERGLRIISSAPRELVALVFSQNRPPAEPVRRALTLAVDRRSMWSALWQRQGEPAAALLPQWLSGYAVLFETSPDRTRARSIVETVSAAERALTLRITESDPLLRSIAERIAVDVREVNLAISIVPADAPPARVADMHLVRLGIDATTPERALGGLVQELGIQVTQPALGDGSGTHGSSLATVYQAEQKLLAEHMVVPLAHIPDIYAAGPRVNSWNEALVLPSGSWNLANAWLTVIKP
jgi:MarR-like DNA-binding transcriptional regulator SgrR of sgrS sRNA